MQFYFHGDTFSKFHTLCTNEQLNQQTKHKVFKKQLNQQTNECKVFKATNQRIKKFFPCNFTYMATPSANFTHYVRTYS